MLAIGGGSPRGANGSIQYNNNGEFGGTPASILNNQLVFTVGSIPVTIGDLFPSDPGIVPGFGVGDLSSGNGSFFLSRGANGPIVQVGDGSDAYAYMSFVDPITLEYVEGAPNFQLIPTSGSATNTALQLGVLLLGGSTSGYAKIQVAATAGSPNPLQLPTATGSAGEVLATDGNNPQQLYWTNPAVLPSYAVSALPVAPTAGSTAYASNGRKVGEGANSGTGVPVYYSNGSWRVYSTDAAVQS